MSRILVLSVLMLFILSISIANAATFELSSRNFSTTAIVYSSSSLQILFPAQELQKHLQLITGYTFPLVTTKGTYKKVFYVGIIPASDKRVIENEEARYLITGDAVYMYGEDYIDSAGIDNIDTMTRTSYNRTGTLFAVYDFLENELGVHWIEPTDAGIYYEPTTKISLKEKSHSWKSVFLYQRGFRSTNFRSGSQFGPKSSTTTPSDLKLTTAQAYTKYQDNLLWQKRMHMGIRNPRIFFGHAFGTWWEKYGTTHNEYFAMHTNGLRTPVNNADRIKICPSTMGVATQLVDDQWAANGGTRLGAFTICENDGDSAGLSKEFCHCANCTALDFLKPGEKFGANITDRYVRLANNVMAYAATKDANAVPGMYAYSYYINPPRQIHIDSRVAVAFVPLFNNDFAKTEATFIGWKKMGATKNFLRPNDLGAELGLPMGTEKRIYQAFQLSMKYNMTGIDYDSCFNFWTGISGITYYILARGQIDYTKPFEYWEDEYCSVYGLAKEDVKKYFKYWREQVFDKRLLTPTSSKYLGWGQLDTVGAKINTYYNAADFATTGQYLTDASAKTLTTVQRNLLNKLLIGHEHARLSFLAMKANASGGVADYTLAANKLLAYRRVHKDDLLIDWENLFECQEQYGDICAMNKITR